MNYQAWEGFTDVRFGYGAMLAGFVDHVPAGVQLHKRATSHVHMGIPMSVKGWFEGQHRTLFTMWETDRLPNTFIRYLPLYHRVLVPCQHNVELFSKHHPDVRHVPLGVDTSFWCPQPYRRGEVFRFAAGGSLWHRKGLDLVVEAFNKLNLPDAELHIKAAPHAKDVPATPLGDRVFLHRQWMSAEAQRDWFNEADCFVAASRGEGFGLMPLQTIALGVPTVVSMSTGQVQFAHLATHQVRCGKKNAESIGMWDEPNLSELMGAMKDVYRNRWVRRTEAQQRAKDAKQFEWSTAAQVLVDNLPTGTLLGPARKVPAFVEVRVKANRRVDATIGEHRVRLQPGEESVVTDGVYQVLYDSGAVRMVGDGI